MELEEKLFQEHQRKLEEKKYRICEELDVQR